MPSSTSSRSSQHESAPTHDIVAKLWHLCNILRDSGINYPEYVTELTYLLFLRMAEETGAEAELPQGYRWRDLARKPDTQKFNFYKKLLDRLGTATRGRVRAIFTEADTCLSNPKHLSLLVNEFSQINWYAAREETALADVYEGLLEKNSTESKGGAGQYFTPRPLIECMVELVKPQAGETVQDPACGTAGFLIAAHRYIQRTSVGRKKFTRLEMTFQRQKAYIGVELVTNTHRLALMNAMLHGIHSPILLGDALGEIGAGLEAADVILTNPPFGTKKGGGLTSRTDFKWRVSNKQLCFLQHIYQGLKPGGRAAVVMPGLQGQAAPDICADLMDKCNLHTVLRLPAGIFYAHGVKTNVLFFTRGKANTRNTKDIWIYDLRANMPTFGKRTPFNRVHLSDFENAYGANPNGTSHRISTERFRRFTREDIRRRGENFDISWLREETAAANADGREPEELLTGVLQKLRATLIQMEGLERNLRR